MTEKRENYSTWVEIDLGAIEQNARNFCQRTGVEVMAVVKANAYGHGAVPAARSAVRGGATWLAVARIEEALELRQADLENPILILGYTPPKRLVEAVANDVSLTVWDVDHFQAISRVAQNLGKTARLHLKVDTGMSRLGIQPSQAVELVENVQGLPGIILEGIFTHFARADESDPQPTDSQLRSFREVIEILEAKRLRPAYVHAANSAAGLRRPEAYFDLVRMGIALYGLHPSSECPLPQEFRPALTWKTQLSHLKTLPAGRGVSYGHMYTTRVRERIGTLPVGYADGFRRLSGNQVLVNGLKVPVIGRVTMDQIMVQLDGVPQAKAGDEVVLIGQQGKARITAEQVADTWGTINYEVVCAIGARVPRIYG
ncbi:MAG: alanine racemase [Anaerolineales bacterium]|jgi:alanine racemase